MLKEENIMATETHSRMWVVGFTGTRRGMTPEQKAKVEEILDNFKPGVAIHGDCYGADSDFHKLCQDREMKIILRPCNLEKQRAFSEGASKVFEPEPPLERNKKIVTDADFMIAVPGEDIEVLRSGTWATIRYSLKTEGQQIYIVKPKGDVVVAQKTLY